MAAIVYILCAITSFICAFMLLYSWKRSRSRLLFWCCLGFTGLALNNFLLFLDMVIFPDVTYILQFRALPAVIGMILMIYGLIMEEV